MFSNKMGVSRNFSLGLQILAITLILMNLVASAPLTEPIVISSSETILENVVQPTGPLTADDNEEPRVIQETPDPNCTLDPSTSGDDTPTDEEPSIFDYDMAPAFVGIAICLVLVMVFLSLYMCHKRAQDHGHPKCNPKTCHHYPTIIQRLDNPEAFRKWCLSVDPDEPGFLKPKAFDNALYATIHPFTLDGKKGDKDHDDGLNDIREICTPIMLNKPETHPTFMVITVIHADNTETQSVIPWTDDIPFPPK